MTESRELHARDRAVLAGVPTLIAGGCAVLLWLAGFGESGAPERLPWAQLAFFGALFGDLLAHGLRRLDRAGAVWLTAGLALAALAAGFTDLPQRYLTAPASAALLGVVFAALPRQRGEMLGAMSVYAAATLLANYTFDAFLPLGDWFLVNVGTFFFGVTFTQRDRVHRFGRRAVYAMILAAAVANVAVALSLDTPLRYVAVSFLTIVVAETADTEVYQRLLQRRWFFRVATSNAVSVPLDTVLFTVLAFAGAPFASAAWMTQVIVTDVIVKYGSSLLTALGLLGARARMVRTLEP